MSYAFVLDASACSGCKACQVACKDKNQLPLGVLWRRVYEVSGGTWKQEGAAWTNTLFAYNLSLSCNHCVHPKCAGVCPVDAYTVRADGIVILDTSKCIGCGYCAWACPYGAPQYDRHAGHMTKCNFCYDNLEAGLPPACVAACPLRALNYVEADDGRLIAAGHVTLWDTDAASHPYPLAKDSRTRPHLAIKPHAAMASEAEKRIANGEEVRPQPRSGWEEAPLVAFTLLAQMAVGSLWAMLWLFRGAQPLLLPLLWVGLCLGAGMMASFAHLGTKRNAWRALNHLCKSWLSRELLFTILFGAGWLATAGSGMLHADFPVIRWLAALIGLELVHCMSRVYRLRTVPAWDTWLTEARFFLSAGLLGTLSTTAVLEWTHAAIIPATQAGSLVMALLAAEMLLEAGKPLSISGRNLRLVLILMSMAVCAAVFFAPGWPGPYSASLLALIGLAEQILGRRQFYAARD